mgnify:CR=1 FL=1
MVKPIEITDETFEEEEINSELPVLVDFWADWCGPCKMVAPVVEDLAGEFEGKVKVGKLDVDSSPKTAQKYGIRGIPNLTIFEKGEVVGQLVGVQPKANIKKRLDETIS